MFVRALGDGGGQLIRLTILLSAPKSFSTPDTRRPTALGCAPDERCHHPDVTVQPAGHTTVLRIPTSRRSTGSSEFTGQSLVDNGKEAEATGGRQVERTHSRLRVSRVMTTLCARLVPTSIRVTLASRRDHSSGKSFV